MNWNVTAFPVEKRVNSENDGIWWGVYFIVEWMAKRIHYLLKVLERQDTSVEWSQSYKYVRKRTIKRCFLALSKKWKKLENNIQLLRTDTIAFDTAISIFSELLKIKQKRKNTDIELLKEELSGMDASAREIEIIILLLWQFQLIPSQIIHTLNGHTSYKIHWYEDDTYSFLRNLQRTEHN